MGRFDLSGIPLCRLMRPSFGAVVGDAADGEVPLKTPCDHDFQPWLSSSRDRHNRPVTNRKWLPNRDTVLHLLPNLKSFTPTARNERGANPASSLHSLRYS